MPIFLTDVDIMELNYLVRQYFRVIEADLLKQFMDARTKQLNKEIENARSTQIPREIPKDTQSDA